MAGIRFEMRPSVTEDPFGPEFLLFESEKEWLDETPEFQLQAI